MKSNVLAFAIAAASLGFSTVTLAHDHDRRDSRETYVRPVQHVNPYGVYRVEQRADWQKQREKERKEERREARRADKHQERWEDRGHSHGHQTKDYRGYHHPIYYNARGPQFKRGGYIPREFRNHQYRVVNYQAYRLSAPPRGHQWVQVGADYVLIALATGLIAHIVLNY